MAKRMISDTFNKNSIGLMPYAYLLNWNDFNIVKESGLRYLFHYYPSNVLFYKVIRSKTD